MLTVLLRQTRQQIPIKRRENILNQLSFRLIKYPNNSSEFIKNNPLKVNIKQLITIRPIIISLGPTVLLAKATCKIRVYQMIRSVA